VVLAEELFDAGVALAVLAAATDFTCPDTDEARKALKARAAKTGIFIVVFTLFQGS
jgi:hypothetical protein